MRYHQGPIQNMQRHPPKKCLSVGPLPSPPSSPHRSTNSRAFHNVQTRREDREVIESKSGPTALPTSRPGSAMSSYTPLPGIGHSRRDADIATGILNLELNERDRPVHSPSSDSGTQIRTKDKDSRAREGWHTQGRTKRSASLSSESNTRKVSRREMRTQQFARRKHSQKSLSIADEPTEGEERLLMAIKLPEGERLERYFRPTDQVTSILLYAEHSTRRSFSDCQVFTNGVPKKLISDLSLTISDAGLGNRTLLYLEEKDE